MTTRDGNEPEVQLHETERPVSTEDLRSIYGYWGEHPEHMVDDWIHAAKAEDTRLGYWDWVASMIELEGAEPEPRAPVKMVCSYCGSENVTRDANAQWNVQEQEWQLTDVMDQPSTCGQCGGECSIEELPIDSAAEDDGQDDAPETDPENVYGLAGIRQSVEEDRK